MFGLDFFSFFVPVQECCYRASQPGYGALVLGKPDGGNPQRFSHLSSPAMYQTLEAQPYQWCCKDTALCDYFYEKRPSQSCENYQAPEIGQ